MKKNIIALGILAGFIFSCQQEEISTNGIIKDHFYLENNGACMPIFVEGNIDSRKIAIILHCGPGDGSLYLNVGEVNHIAEKEFAIAYWDQRISGSSQGNQQDKSLNAYTDDLKKLILLLHYRYGDDVKIYLLAHSWGGLIAPKFLQQKNNQDLVNGWIQVDGAHNYPLNDSLTRIALIQIGKQELAKGRFAEEWKEIVDYCENHDPKNNREVARKINSYANDTDHYLPEVNEEFPSTRDRIKLLTREYHYPQTTFLVNGIYNHLIGKIEEQAYKEDIAKNLPLIQIPTLLLWGRYDFVCPLGLMEEISDNVSSTDVTTRIFENSGHSPMMNEPTDFWITVANWIEEH